MKEIIVNTQKDLDLIPEDFDGIISIRGKNIWVKKRYKNSSVVARENSSVVAWGNSSVVARENSSVEAWGNSSVVARENSSVEAWGNVQVVNRSQKSKIKISGNARIVYNPRNIFEFLDFYGIKHTKTKATFYKAVHNKGNRYISDYKSSFVYEVGKSFKEECDTSRENECSKGLHIAYLEWALRFGQGWKDLAILEVESKISDIVMPTDTDGKVRTCKLKVLREIPLEECGLYGKILSRRLKNGKV